MTTTARTQVAAWLASEASATLAGDVESVRAQIEQARSEGVSALLCERWRDAIDADDDRVAPLSAEIARQVASELVRADAEQRVLSALADAGLDVLVLKGAALARWLYARPHWRPRGDLDLLFASEAVAMQAETVLAALGYRWDGVLANGVCIERTLVGWQRGITHHIDLHWRLTPHPAYADRFAFDTLRRERQPLPGLRGGFGLGGVHALVHAALHRVANRWLGEEDRVVWLYDIHLLAARLRPEDEAVLLDCARVHGVAAPLHDALQRSADWLGTAVSTSTMSELAALAAGETFQPDDSLDRRKYEWQAVRRLPPTQRWAYLLRQLFPAVDYMRQRYGAQSLPALAIAYPRRWLDGLKLLFRG